MMLKPDFAVVFGRARASLRRFRDDETGSMAFFILFMFIIMMMFGGIAVDVMRFETRRVAMQQTLDRAALAAASLTQKKTPQAVVEDWFIKAGLEGDLGMVRFSDPTVSSVVDAALRRVTVSAEVRSYNYFMTLFSKNDYLEGPTVTEAAQGVSEIEVMLVLDITGSMGESAGMTDDPATPLVNEASTTKIEALRSAAQDFVTIVKSNDKKNGISIGVVPYAAQVNIPLNLRQQFTAVQNISSWNGVANAGVPNINCFEIPTSSYTSTALALTSPIRMAAVADGNSGTTTTPNWVAVSSGAPSATSRACTTNAETGATPYVDAEVNHVLLPTKDGDVVKQKISRLTAQGNTSIAVGMRWGTALIDQEARPIYTAIGDPSVLGRPADNNSTAVRKIIVLMTDGSHVTNSHIVDAFKTGKSPIYRGTDGNFAIRFTSVTDAQPLSLTSGTRPGISATNTCSGWVLGSRREYFVPHLKRNSLKRKVGATEAEGKGTGVDTPGTCEPRAWVAGPTGPWNATVGGPLTWPVYDAAGNKTKDALGVDIAIVATQLDWSEVWRYLRVSWVARQLYMRSGVSGATNYSTVMNTFRTTYLTSAAYMDALLQENCAVAKADTALGGSGIEVYGIAFAAPAEGQAQISGCSSDPKIDYYFNALNGNDLRSAFNEISRDIQELRLTQ